MSSNMSSFAKTNIKVLLTGALVLGAGVYYQGFAAQRVVQAQQALRSVEARQSQLETATQYAHKYNALLATMANKNTDRQEPFSVVSEFSVQEFMQIGSLLDTLYQRDGHFFLQRFQLAWRHGDEKRGLLPRVVLDLEGKKVLLFSDEAVGAASLAVVNP
jgi:hypothetical protein